MDHEEEIMRLRNGHERLAETVHQLAVAQTETQGVVRETSNSVQALVNTLDKRFAPLSRFELVEKGVLGTMALILIGVFGAWLSQVVIKPAG